MCPAVLPDDLVIIPHDMEKVKCFYKYFLYKRKNRFSLQVVQFAHSCEVKRAARVMLALRRGFVALRGVFLGRVGTFSHQTRSFLLKQMEKCAIM